MVALVGYTGFVGSNIYAKAGEEIKAIYNSKNIEQAYGTNPELLIYAGMRAEKYLANHAPERDMALVLEAEENIRRINPQRLVLISTIDVFKTPRGVDENTEIETEGLNAYGYNRYQLELWVRKNYPDALIIRLPGLFGRNIKKNFIYDYINVIPFMLNKKKMEELSDKDAELIGYYTLQDNGFYKVNDVSEDDKAILRNKFKKLGFTALSFTDSRSRYQFYNLGRLWNDIQIAIKHGIRIWHPASEPISAGELYEYLARESFVNILDSIPADYDYKTVYDSVFGGAGGYIIDKSEILSQIKLFVEENKR